MIPKEIKYNLHYEYLDFLPVCFFAHFSSPAKGSTQRNGLLQKPFLFDWTLFLEGKKILKSCLRWTCVIPFKP